jgi:hypothetical protein
VRRISAGRLSGLWPGLQTNHDNTRIYKMSMVVVIIQRNKDEPGVLADRMGALGLISSDQCHVGD